MGQGESYLVLRLAPSGAAQLWDPLTGEALCIRSNEDQQQQQQGPQPQPQQTDADLWRQQMDVLGALQGIAAEQERLQQRADWLLPIAERFADSQHHSLQEMLQRQAQQESQLGVDVAAQRGGDAVIEELRHLERNLGELRTNEEALIKHWHVLHAAESSPSPFLLGGPRQKSREGLWPVARLCLLVGQQNAYINLQRMRCINSRRSPLEAPTLINPAQEAPAEFVPVTSSSGAPESEQRIRRSIRTRMQRRHRWRWLGLPALATAMRRVAQVAASATWWLSCYMNCIGLLCCDRY